LIDKNSLWRGLNIQRRELCVKGILAQDLGSFWGAFQRGFEGFSRWKWRAESYFRKVIELSPGIDQGYLNLGLLYELKGEPSKALPLLEKAFSLNPENPKTKEHLQRLRGSKRDASFKNK